MPLGFPTVLYHDPESEWQLEPFTPDAVSVIEHCVVVPEHVAQVHPQQHAEFVAEFFRIFPVVALRLAFPVDARWSLPAVMCKLPNPCR
jgi:hypothetical protein